MRCAGRKALSDKRFAPWRWVLTASISAALVLWLVWTVSPEELARAAHQVPWVPLACLTLTLVMAMFLWDVVCVRWLFALPGRQLSFGTAAGARAGSYLWTAFNYEAGQAMLALRVARAQQASFL